MKKMEITINEDGTTDIDLKEGFSGMSCVEKAKQIELILNGNEIDRKEKPQLHESDFSQIDLGINLGY